MRTSPRINARDSNSDRYHLQHLPQRKALRAMLGALRRLPRTHLPRPKQCERGRLVEANSDRRVIVIHGPESTKRPRRLQRAYSTCVVDRPLLPATAGNLPAPVARPVARHVTSRSPRPGSKTRTKNKKIFCDDWSVLKTTRQPLLPSRCDASATGRPWDAERSLDVSAADAGVEC